MSRLTYRVRLPGGQDRLRDLILYVSERCAEVPRFGRTMLHRIVWTADFEAFAERGVPVTGRPYVKRDTGPVPLEMPAVLREMEREGLLAFEEVELEGVLECRPSPKRRADMRLLFSDDDMRFVDAAIDRCRRMAELEVHDGARGIAWLARADMAPMPYEGAYLSDAPPSPELLQRMRRHAEAAGLTSK